MTRVIAGVHRGRRLRVPGGGATRPTADRAREGLFSSLQSLVDVAGCRFLDLYAGSGALGLEALSRGADRVTLVEQDERALAALHANVAALVGGVAELAGGAATLAGGAAALAARAAGLASGPSPGAVDVVARSVGRYLSGEPAPYDVVALDPPYDLDVQAVLGQLPPWLADGGVVVLERRTGGPEPAWPAGLEPLRSRRYGQATLWYGSRS